MNPERTSEFAKDLDYESLLEGVNRTVVGWGEEEGLIPERPLLFIVGAPRSGTTLLYQVLAATGGFEYPTNLVARFYRSPAWGSRVQRLLEPILHRGEMSFKSRAGNTDDWWGPHEFGYFWEHHFDFSSHHEPEDPDLTSLTRALGAFEREGDRPLLFKNTILCFVVEALAEALPTARFLWTKRPLLDVADSIYRTRLRFFGDPRGWISARPSDAPVDADPATQIAHQLARIQQSLSRASDRLQDRVTAVRYSDLCADPRGEALKVGERAGITLDVCGVPSSFPPSKAESGSKVEGELKTALLKRKELDPEAL